MHRHASKALVSFICFCLLDLSVAAANAQAAEKSQGEIESSSSSDCKLHTLQVSNLSPTQGETIKVSTATGDSSSVVSFNGTQFKMFASGTKYEALLAVPVTINPGKYVIKCGDESVKITVKDAHFPVHGLRLPPDKDNFKASPGEKEEMEKAKATCSDTRLWTEVFAKPISGAGMSSPFGVRRKVNGKLLPDYFHSGVDFRAVTGTPILAVAPGVVIAARPHKISRLHGNFVCLDHGQGVISIYIHMNSIAVKVGDKVEAGQKVGTVGKTGRANGPHLHFGIYVNQTAANPKFWFSQNF